MSTIRAIIVDDELDSREILRNYTAKYCPGLQVVAECANVEEAKAAIAEHRPELVFLDIEMPYGNAFDLLEQLETIDFEAIFITAFSQYAIQALNLSAAYYVLKPIDIEALIQAVEKARRRIQENEALNTARILKENLSLGQKEKQRAALPLIDGFEVVELSEILYCEANDNFTDFHLADGRKLMICRKLKYYENLLSGQGFCRIHRSCMVNLDYVRRYIKGKGGSVVLANGKELQVSNSRKRDFLEKFK
ncbi:MAG: response regulator transcription factor [Lewinellaceae bacterium]|nr:response regulator transcription factor [Phaeodactylibacter sp.]MCB9041133.1 response regulator transcription factor [Lewinellaceae bacterium]